MALVVSSVELAFVLRQTLYVWYTFLHCCMTHRCTLATRRHIQHAAYVTKHLSPCDYGAFGPLKKFLEGQRFSDDEEVTTAVKKWTFQAGWKPDHLHPQISISPLGRIFVGQNLKILKIFSTRQINNAVNLLPLEIRAFQYFIYHRDAHGSRAAGSKIVNIYEIDQRFEFSSP